MQTGKTKIMNLTTSHKRSILVVFALLVTFLSYSQSKLVHPGLSHKESDLMRMRYMVEAGIDPWLTSFQNMAADSKASYDYEVRGDASMTTVTQDGLNYGAFSSDSRAAYLQAIMWAVTGDDRHAEKAVEIFNAWSNLTEFTGGGTESLNAGRVIWMMVEGAEIIKSLYNGWAEADITKFGEMLVYPGLSHSSIPGDLSTTNGTFYWRMYNGDPGRHGNQDLFGWRGVMAIGVFLDDTIMYQRAKNYLLGLPHPSNDISYQSGPPIRSASPIATNDYFDTYSISGFKTDSTDYGYNGVIKHFIWENGQCQESSRDQDHAILGVGMVASLAEIVWNQGDDIWGYLDSRILKGYEFALRYNISYNYSYADQTTPWEPTVENGEFIERHDRSGRWYSKKVNPYNEGNQTEEGLTRGERFSAQHRPIYELALAHYDTRMGMASDDYKWITRANEISLDESGQERNGHSLDHLGWGGLTAKRSVWAAGDPCYFEDGQPVYALPSIPTTIEAENFDFFTANAEGRTVLDLSAGNSEGQYRTNEDVDIETCSEGGYNITSMENGEWMSYTFNIPTTSTYDISIRYSAANANGKIKLAIDESDITSIVDIPFGGEFSTGLTDWQDFSVIESVVLNTGVQTMRIYVEGASDAFKLNNFSIQYHTEGESSILLDAESSGSGIKVSWQTENFVPDSTNLYRNTDPDFSTSTLIGTDLSTSSYYDNTASGDKIYYWVEIFDVDGIRILSDSVSTVSTVGLIDDEFDEDLNSWFAATTNASAEAIDGQLVMTLAEVLPGIWRGDMSRGQGAILHAGNYPIVAIRIKLPEVVNIHLDTEIGSFGNGANNWTGKVGEEVYYYDLTARGFGSEGTMLPMDQTSTFTRFQFKVADITSGETQYTSDWVKTFRSLEDLQAFVAADTLGKKPIASFNSDKTKIMVDDTVQFFDRSVNSPTSWSWNFGDGSTSTDQNPSHIYTEAGDFTVTLTAVNQYGEDTDTIIDHITVEAPGTAPIATFSVNTTSIDPRGVVIFTDASENKPESWSWDFGDGTTSTNPSPVHIYMEAGTYTVTLTVTNSHGSDTEVKEDLIQVGVTAIFQNQIEKIKVGLRNGSLLLNNLPLNTTVMVYNIMGQQIASVPYESSSLSIQLPDPGMYLVHFKNGTNHKTVKLIY